LTLRTVAAELYANLVETKINMKKIFVLTVAALAATALVARAAEAKEIFDKQCIKCHGTEGKGDTPAGKKMGAANFTDPKLQEKFTDEQLFKTIKEGVKDPEGKIKMKPAENVTDDEIKALVKLVRSFKK
jgi:cytochrome c551/c552